MKRTLNIDTIKKINEQILLKGWVHSIRTHGKITFIDLRDATGLVQVVFKGALDLKQEYIIEVIGEVKKRPENMINTEIKTGTIEIKADTCLLYTSRCV